MKYGIHGILILRHSIKGRCAMFGLGAQELIILLVILLILFGATRLPELGKGIGLAIRNFKKSTNELKEKDPETKKTPVTDQDITKDKTSHSDEPH